MRLLLLAVVLCFSAAVYAQPISPGDVGDSTTPDARQRDAENDTHPVLSADAAWAGSIVIGIAGLFLAAMVVGPMVHAEKVEELPAHASHDTHHAQHH
jgi:hypothetical protein